MLNETEGNILLYEHIGTAKASGDCNPWGKSRLRKSVKIEIGQLISRGIEMPYGLMMMMIMNMIVAT
jgi:hypothetical protein